jgi:hypothetical protein
MKTPRNAMSALFREGLIEFDPGPLAAAGQLGRHHPKFLMKYPG